MRGMQNGNVYSRTEIAELEKTYKTFRSSCVSKMCLEECLHALINYLRVIEDTPTLKAIAQKIFTNQPHSFLYTLGNFYKALQRKWETDYNPSGQMLAEMNRFIFNGVRSDISPLIDILQIRAMVSAFHSQMCAKSVHQIKIGDKRARLIEKDGRGDFFYDGKRISISKDTIYYKVFDAIYSNADQDGFTSYETVEKYLVLCGCSSKESSGKRDKRVNNAISKKQGLFRYAKVQGKLLKNWTLDGKKLIEVLRGKGLILNNPSLE